MNPATDDSPNRVEKFLFAPADARAAAFLRILLAAMLAWAFDSTGLTPMAPLSTLPRAGWAYDHVFMTGWYRIAVLAAIALFGVGWRPRMMGLILIVMLFPLISLSAGRQSRPVLLIVLFAFCMLRSDARWSVRTWLGGAPASSAGPMWPIRLIQIQLSVVYLINVIAKATPEYMGGDALVAMTQMRPNFLVDMSDGFLHVGPWQIPAAWAATSSVIAEAYLTVGFWFPRLRWFTAAFGVGFHLCLQQIIQIFMLDYVCMFLYIVFLLRWSARDETNSENVMRSNVIPEHLSAREIA